jgi:hypothetical protein
VLRLQEEDEAGYLSRVDVCTLDRGEVVDIRLDRRQKNRKLADFLLTQQTGRRNLEVTRRAP